MTLTSIIKQVITLLHSQPGSNAPQILEASALADVATRPGWFWLDLLAEDDATIEETGGLLGLRQFDIEHVLHLTEFPKFEERDNYVFLITHTPSLDELVLRTVEVDLFLGTKFLVSIRREDTPGLSAIRSLVNQGAVSDPASLTALITELFGRRMLPLLTGVDEAIYELEDQALAGNPEVPHQVQALRRDAIRLRRIVGPQRDAQRLLATSQRLVTSDVARGRFMSAHDDYARIAESLDTARSLLASVLDTYRATVAEKMNEVMKVLTVFSAIVLPLGLMAGIYGMNFRDMPGVEWASGFWALSTVMALTAAALWFYFVRRGFIGGPRIPRVDRAVSRGMAGFVHLTLAPVRLFEKVVVENLDRESE